MFWIAFAAQLSLPVPVGVRIPDVRAVFSPDDMPDYVQIAGINRIIATRTTIRPDGAPQDCTQDRASGDRKLDAYTCAIILKRAKFEPARWIDGSQVYAVLRTPVTWAIGGPASKSEFEEAYPPDMDILVSRLPPGAGSRASLKLVIAVNENGRVVSCEVAPQVKWDHAKVFPELVPIACQQLINQFTVIPAKDGAGKPVRSVQTASVAFTTDERPAGPRRKSGSTP